MHGSIPTNRSIKGVKVFDIAAPGFLLLQEKEIEKCPCFSDFIQQLSSATEGNHLTPETNSSSKPLRIHNNKTGIFKLCQHFSCRRDML